MRFDSIHLTNYRCHASLQLNFKPGFNVIVGVNGSGKTSVLTAICDALTGFSKHMSVPRGSYQALGDPNVVRLKGEEFDGRYRFEPQYPVKVSATADAFDGHSVCIWTIQKTSQVDDPEQTGASPDQVWQAIQQAGAHQSEKVRAQPALPIIAFYRANRHWNQPQPHELQAATVKPKQQQAVRLPQQAPAEGGKPLSEQRPRSTSTVRSRRAKAPSWRRT